MESAKKDSEKSEIKLPLMEKQPALKVLILFVTGIISGRYFHSAPSLPIVILITFFVFAIIFYFSKKNVICNIFLGLCVVISGFTLTSDFFYNAKSETKILEKYFGEKVEIKGTIVDEAGIYPNRFEYNLFVDEIGNEKVNVLVKLKDYDKRLFLYNDKIKFKARINKPLGFGNSSYTFYLFCEKIRAIVKTKEETVIEITGKGNGNIFKTASLSLKSYIQDIFSKTFLGVESPLLFGIIFGGHSNLPEEVWDVFRNTGTVHILAVSGMNVALVGGIAFVLFANILRLPQKIAVLPAIVIIWFYALVTGMNSPVVRSAITISILLLGYLFEREANVTNSLAVAALVILAFEPLSLFSISFQLSFVCVLSIIFLYPELDSLFNKRNNRIQIIIKPDTSYLKVFFDNVKKLILISLAVQIGIWPLTAFYFSNFTPVSIVANLVVVPLVSMILYLGILLPFFYAFSFFVTQILADANWFLMKLLLNSVIFFSGIPYSNIRISKPGLFFVLGYYILLVLLVIGQSKRRLSISTNHLNK